MCLHLLGGGGGGGGGGDGILLLKSGFGNGGVAKYVQCHAKIALNPIELFAWVAAKSAQIHPIL